MANYPEDDIEDDYPDFDDEWDEPEPVGSCDHCGTNLYPNDDPELCDQCMWYAEQNKGGDDCGIQPVT